MQPAFIVNALFALLKYADNQSE